MTLRQRQYLSEGKRLETVLKNTLVLNGFILPGLMDQKSPVAWNSHEKESIRKQWLKMSTGKANKFTGFLNQMEQKHGSKNPELVKQIDKLKGILGGLDD